MPSTNFFSKLKIFNREKKNRSELRVEGGGLQLSDLLPRGSRPMQPKEREQEKNPRAF